MTTDPQTLNQLQHDLFTPVYHITGHCELMLEEAGEAERTAWEPDLHQIHADGRQLLGLINNFLASLGKAAQAVDLASARHALLAPLERIAARGLALKRRHAGLGAAHLLADLERILSAAASLRALIGQLAAEAADGPGANAAGEGANAAVEHGTLLVVDDNEENRDMLARRLRHQGYRAVVAPGGREALKTLETTAVDMVLLDVMMPEMDGYEVLQCLKADARLRDIPVLMISASGEIKSVVRCIELGAEDYLSKPFNPILLQARIGACLEKKRLRDRELRHIQEIAEWNRTLEQRVQAQVSQLERLGRLKRFFTPQLAELIVAGDADDPLKSHRREVAVVFLDLHGFTAFAEISEPEEVMSVLREYHAAMGQLILAHAGTLGSFTGDGMMILFNDPVLVPNPTEHAVRMALAVRERVGELTGKWRKRGHDLGHGVGIAKGYATIGTIGFEGRYDYGVIGSVVNLAARLCAEAGSGQILSNQKTLHEVEDLVAAEAVGELTLKGFSHPVAAFNILRLKQ